MAEHPFAHLFSTTAGLGATRVPVIADLVDAVPVRLRGHLNGHNPQAAGLDGASVLVVFSGPSTYVSPHWRVSATRGGTYDYEEVQVHGVARVVHTLDFFRRLVDDLSALIEPQYADVGDYPVWQTAMAPPGYVERLLPQVTPFAIEIASVRTISKLHQHFPLEDRRCIAAHLARSRREDARSIAEKIRRCTADE